jgi:hypothetical protein
MTGGPDGGAVVVPVPPQADRTKRKVQAYWRDVIESILGKGEVFAAFPLWTRLTRDLFPRRVDLAASRSTYK